MDDFFIGYEPPMPSSLTRFARRASLAAIAGATGVALLLGTAGHRKLEGGTFAFGSPETVTGRVIEHPHPALVEDGRQPAATTLLVARGKHGAATLVAGLDGGQVSLAGTRIRRHGYDMLEVVPGTVALAPRPSIRPATGTSHEQVGRRAGGDVTAETPAPVPLLGEVVDTKCYLGVMVPGDGLTHGACASLCLRGGIPAAFVVRSDDGTRQLYLLETPSGAALGQTVSAWVGRPVLVTGVRGQRDGWPTLRTTPATWRAAP